MHTLQTEENEVNYRRGDRVCSYDIPTTAFVPHPL